MALKEFGLSALADIDDGRVREAFEQALKRCKDDCEDRPALDKSRKLTLSLEIVPVCNDEGSFDSCDIQVQIKDSLPERKSKVYNMQAKRGALLYNDLSSDNASQRTIDEVESKLGPKGEVPNVG